MDRPIKDPKHNFYAGGDLDRADHLRSDADWLSARLNDPETRFLPVWRSQSFVVVNDASVSAASLVWIAGRHSTTLIKQANELVFLGRASERTYIAADLSPLEPEHAQTIAGDRGEFRDLREIGPILPRRDGAILAYARGLLHWHRNHQFCGRCGSPTQSDHGGHVRRCTNPSCGTAHFPRTDPAVIMLIHDGADRCVLGRQRSWPPGMHSTLAGFVEPGESLEDAVAREVMEEVGLSLREVMYHSSQPWPFPASLMLGFHARTDDDRLCVNENELDSAAWFSRADLEASPEDETFRLPRADSIARRLIEDWLAAG